MQPAAVLSVLVTTEGVGPANAKLNSVQSTLKKTAAVADTAGSSVARTGSRLEKAGAGMTKVGKAATRYYAAPLLAAAGAAVYFGQKYEKSMLMVQTHTDTNRKDLALYKREILEMGSSGKYTQGPSELGEAMYHIASDGYKGIEAVNMLKKSADLAMVGQSNLAESTYALVSAMKTGIRGTESSGKAINTLNAIVGAGDMKMQELVGAMSTGILPAAKAMGLSLKDVGVAEDIMTQRGVPAQQAAYRLAMTFQMLIPHTEKAEDAFKMLGLSNQSLIEEMEKNPKEGLLAALELLHERLNKNLGPKGVDQIQTIEEIFGGGRTSRGAITLLQNLDSVKETYGRINQLAGETPKKIAQAKAAPVNKLKEAWVQVETVLTELGVTLIPMVAEGISWLAHEVENVANFFSSLPPGLQAVIIKFLAITVAITILIRFFGPLFTAFGQLLAWLARTEAETDTAIATNEALGASYGETAAAAEASAAAQIASIEEVTAAQKVAEAERLAGLPIGGLSGQQTMDALMPIETGAGAAATGGQMSLFGKAASGAGAATAAAEAGGEAAAGSFATGFAAALPAAIGAIALPVTAFAAVTIPLAIADINEGPAPSKYQKRVQASHRHVEKTHKQQRHTFEKANRYEEELHGMKQKEIQANKRMTEAEKNLKQARKGLGPESHNLARAEMERATAQHRQIALLHQQNQLEHKHGMELQIAKHRSVEAVAASIVEIHNLKSQEKHIEALIKKEKEAGDFSWKEGTRGAENVARLEKVWGAEEKAVGKKQQALATAEKEVGSKFAGSLKNMSIAQAKFGTHYQGLRKIIEHDPIKMHEIETQHAKHQLFNNFLNPFKNESQKAAQHSAQSFKNWETTVTGAMGSVGGEMNKMLSAMGANPIQFGVHKNKVHEKARGGHINVGAASGDSVPALLEKGEYVMNREAVAHVGLHKLNEINFGKAPRFQEGGAVGNIGAAMAEANKIDSQEFAYKWGGGHGGFEGPYDCSGAVSAVLHAAGLLDRPMVSGELASYGAAGSGPITIYANGVHAFMSIMGRFFGTSGSNPGGGAGWFSSALGRGEASEGDLGGAFAVRHPTGVMAETLKSLALSGPEGKLKQIGQKAIDNVYKAANHKLQESMGGSFGGGDANIESVMGNWGESQLEKLWIAEGGPAQAAHTAAAIAMAESGGDPHAHNPSGATGLWQILGAVRPGNLFEPKVNALNAVAKYKEAGDSFAPWEAFTNGAYQQFMQKGGSAGDKKKPESIEKTIKEALHGLGEGKRLPKFNSDLKKVGRKISDIDLNKNQMESLGMATKEAERFAEYASNASAMTRSVENEKTEEEEVIPGVFKGMGEGDWLKKELSALITLRSQIIGSHESIANKTLPRVMTLLKHTQERLRAAQKAIREDESKKRELEKKIRDLEKAQNDNINKLEKEKNELERKLNNLQNAKNPDHNAIQKVRDEIKSKNEAINGTNKQTADSIREDKEKIRDIEGDVRSKHRIESGAQTLVESLEERRSSLYETMSNLYGQGGEFSGTGYNFFGLQQVQGAGGTTEDIPVPPEFGTVGGEIFDVQHRLKEIQEEMEKKPKPKKEEQDLEKLELEKELEVDNRMRYQVSQAQSKVLSDFPSVGSIASVPYAGAYAIGGNLLAATVGERGREVAIMPEGSRVVPEHDAKEAIARMGGGGGAPLNIEELHIHEAEKRVSGRANGEEFESDVEKVTRKQSRRSAPNTPGGRRRR